ncbi:MAG: adenine deaminase [Phycisphaerales bacterium]|nr:adenine deaminase [Phycisphaerales bacterium]
MLSCGGIIIISPALLTLRHHLVDLHARRIYPAQVTVDGGRIARVEELPDGANVDSGFIMPGFIDAHVHVESSMLPPREFARVAVRHGTVATVSDPHEIANVLGEAGVEYMLSEAAHACIPIAFGVPSCVPATPFETSGATLDSGTVARMLADPRLGYLAEMMNYPGVLGGDNEVLAKIAAAKCVGKPVDGHAPGLRGDDAARYIAAGISTDHECFTLDEARDKARLGMHILLREGSAARNLEALWPIVREYPHLSMFATDDAHPDDLLRGHINVIAARCIAHGLDIFDVLRAACVHPVLHYRLPTGLLRAGDRADFVILEDLTDFRVRETWIAGTVVARGGESLVPHAAAATPNKFREAQFTARDFIVATRTASASATVRTIEARDGQLTTGEVFASTPSIAGVLEPDPPCDTLLLAVCNRYADAPPALAFIRGFQLRTGAIATSVAHDSHQVIAVGTSRDAIARAVNAVFAARGALAVVSDAGVEQLSLPIAGLMSDRPAEEVAAIYERLTMRAHEMGSQLRAPFMTLSFMALLVIPALKLSDRGLFDARAFEFTTTEIDP